MVTASDVKRLREITGVGMMDCKQALTEAEGDFDKAIELLRKKGQKVAAKRAEREAKEGVIATEVSEDKQTGVIVEVNCETDFVARNEEFTAFADSVARHVLQTQPENMEALENSSLNGQQLGQAVTDMTGKTGEKVDVRRFEVLQAQEGNRIISYIHPGAKLGVLVEARGEKAEDAARDVAMQVAAMNPIATRREEVSEDIQQKEMEIGREQARNEGKPEQILERIAQGKLERYYKDNVLLEQPFVKDSSMTVQEMLKKQGVEVLRFVRYALGG